MPSNYIVIIWTLLSVYPPNIWNLPMALVPHVNRISQIYLSSFSVSHLAKFPFVLPSITIENIDTAQHAKMDLNKKSLPKQKTIKTLKVMTQGFKIIMNENPPRYFFLNKFWFLHRAQWFLGGPKLGKKYWKFQQIFDTKSWSYVRNLVRFGANKISLEMGGDGCSL